MLIAHNCTHMGQILGFNPIHLGSGGKRVNRATNYGGEGGGCPLGGTILTPYLTLQHHMSRKGNGWDNDQTNRCRQCHQYGQYIQQSAIPTQKNKCGMLLLGPFLSGHFLLLKEGGWLFSQPHANRARSTTVTGQFWSLWIVNINFSFHQRLFFLASISMI